MLNHKVALLATGNEIVNGDLLNTNGQAIASLLFNHCIEVGYHLTVTDEQTVIEQAMDVLLASHGALITIGGLGPTSDDKTRFALSSFVKQPLEFHQPSWDALVARLQNIGLEVVESNRQQALFPKYADVIANANGTAAACKVRYGDQLIYMLPGPPTECLPIFTDVVLPDLLKHNFQQPLVRRSWLLLGLSEGNLAHELDAIVDHTHCQIGYRICYPYVELKLAAYSAAILQSEVQKVLPFIQSAIVSEQCQVASTQLIAYILQKTMTLAICDQATGGLLQATLLTPLTKSYLNFTRTDIQHAVRIEVLGLNNYWQHNQASHTEFSLTLQLAEQTYQRNFQIRYGRRDVRSYAVELICWEILKFLRGHLSCSVSS